MSPSGSFENYVLFISRSRSADHAVPLANCRSKKTLLLTGYGGSYCEIQPSDVKGTKIVQLYFQKLYLSNFFVLFRTLSNMLDFEEYRPLGQPLHRYKR